MADGSGGGPRAPASQSAAASSSSASGSASLDGGLLLRLLQNPDHSETAPRPGAPGPHFFDPAVTAVGPLFPSLPHHGGFAWPSPFPAQPQPGFADPRFAPPLDPYLAPGGGGFSTLDGAAATRTEKPRPTAPPPGFGRSSPAAGRHVLGKGTQKGGQNKLSMALHHPNASEVFGRVLHREQQQQEHYLSKTPPTANAHEPFGRIPHREQQQEYYLSKIPHNATTHEAFGRIIPNVNACEAFGAMPYREQQQHQQNHYLSKMQPSPNARETFGMMPQHHLSKMPPSGSAHEMLDKMPHREEQNHLVRKLLDANTHDELGKMPIIGHDRMEGSTGRLVAMDERQEGSKKMAEVNGLEDVGVLEGYLGNGVDGGVTMEVRKLEASYQKSEVLFASKDGEWDDGSKEEDVLIGQLMEAMVVGDDSTVKNGVERRSSRSMDYRSDSRGHKVSNQRIRIQRRSRGCRYDIDHFTPSFLSIFESLVPSEEEIAKQKHLLMSLSQLISKEWPDSKLYLYGSCANSFGFSNSDIDLCLSVDDEERSKVDIILRLADILQAGNLQNVQALTRARVPIVKLMDPDTGLSCDICVNNLLAVVNTKLLKDYAKIDKRLRQLAFIVKHWAKSRRVNETYQGTLSSYAYVIMCIHLLQLRRILPCLQEMGATYFVTVDNTECAYFDRVDMLNNYGARNKESVARLLWAFFHYWAYQHDYTTDVISIRTGRIVSKQIKDWTRRVGNDRHLICIEDPFETSHDLGRVVDKFSIKILREEFERAAHILHYDPNPSITLFEPYVPTPMPSLVQEGAVSTVDTEP